jgi:hypothetical protein
VGLTGPGGLALAAPLNAEYRLVQQERIDWARLLGAFLL